MVWSCVLYMGLQLMRAACHIWNTCYSITICVTYFSLETEIGNVLRTKQEVTNIRTSIQWGLNDGINIFFLKIGNSVICLHIPCTHLSFITNFTRKAFLHRNFCKVLNLKWNYQITNVLLRGDVPCAVKIFLG